jgi:hypothetical protein
MDLSHGAVDAPLGAEATPLGDELFACSDPGIGVDGAVHIPFSENSENTEM